MCRDWPGFKEVCVFSRRTLRLLFAQLIPLLCRRKPRESEPKASNETLEDTASHQHLATRPAENLLPYLPGQPPNNDDVDCRAPGRASDARDPLLKSAPNLSELGTTDGWTRPQASLHYGASQFAAKAWASHQEPLEEDVTPDMRPNQLQWIGERSMKFGSDITYTFYPFLEINNLSNILPQDVSYLEMQGCFRVPTKPVLDELVKQYFLHVHPIMPLYNEGEFWETYGAPSGAAPTHKRVSLLVFQAMLFSSCRVSRVSQIVSITEALTGRSIYHGLL